VSIQRSLLKRETVTVDCPKRICLRNTIGVGGIGISWLLCFSCSKIWARSAVPLQERFRYSSSNENQVLTIAYESRGPCHRGYKSEDLYEQSHPSTAWSSKVGWIVTERRPNSHTPLLHKATEWVDCGWTRSINWGLYFVCVIGNRQMCVCSCRIYLWGLLNVRRMARGCTVKVWGQGVPGDKSSCP
jgi:hypothetical protein